MSDEPDEAFTTVMGHLIGCYGLLHRIFRELPVPVVLPTGVINREMTRQGMIRAAMIADEVPMPIEQRAQMERAALVWLAAEHMIHEFSHQPEEEYLAASAAHCVVLAEDAALELGEWLIDQVKPQEE